jgi:protein tyrosine/serine phosphatase
VKAVRVAGASPSGAGAGGAVYVHCQAGMDRTGFAVAAYRILVDGWDADRAMAELRGYQAFPHALLFPAIEPFVRAVYHDRETFLTRLAPAPTPATHTPAIAKAHAPLAGG